MRHLAHRLGVMLVSRSPGGSRVGRAVRNAVAGILALLLVFSGANTGATVAAGVWNRYLESTGGRMLPFQPSIPKLPNLETVASKQTKTVSASAGVVLVEGQSSAGVLAGTGMVLTSGGRVLTNYHVIRGTDAIAVKIVDLGVQYRAVLVGCDEMRDVALLQLQDARDLVTVTPDNDPVAVGQDVKAVGNARGQGYLSTATGSIVAFNQTVSVRDESQGTKEAVQITGLIQTTAKAVSGDSGGPMMDEQNEVLGMTTAGSLDGSARSYAIPISEALDIVDEIAQGNESGTIRIGPAGFLGVAISSADSGPGVLIASVTSGAPAGQAGIGSGDRLLQVAGKEVTEESVARIIRGVEPGQKAKVKWVTAGGAERESEIVFSESPIN